MIKGLIFDYGGTLDSRGVHWSEVLWQGYSLAGVVEAVGEGVSSVKPGDRVAASWTKHMLFNALSERYSRLIAPVLTPVYIRKHIALRYLTNLTICGIIYSVLLYTFCQALKMICFVKTIRRTS